MSDKKNTEIAVNEGFAALANRDVLNEAMADDCQGLEFFLRPREAARRRRHGFRDSLRRER